MPQPRRPTVTLLPGGAVRVAALAVALVAVWNPTVAWANSAEIFGVGSRYAGMGDASAALVHGPVATFYNPAGVANGRRAEFHFSSTAYVGWLKIRQESTSIENPFEFAIGLTVPVPFKGALANRVWIGLLASAHPDILGRVISHLPTDPFYPYFDNRTQRVVVLPTLAFRLLDHPRYGRLTLGIGVNVFAGLEGVIIGTEGASRSLEARVNQSLSGIFALTAGLRYSWKWLHVGLAFRQQFSMRFATDSFNFVAGTDLDLSIEAEGLFTPHTFVLGLAATPTRRISVGLDFSYGLWSLYNGPFVRVASVLPLVGSLTGDVPDVEFKDTISAKVGFEYRIPVPKGIHLPVRAGLGFESSPVPDQPGRTNMLDGHKLIISAGMGVDLGLLLGRRVWVDMHLRMHVLIPRTFEKVLSAAQPECPASRAPLGPDGALLDEVPCDRTNTETLGFQLSNPGYPRLRASGMVFSGGFTIGVELGRAEKAVPPTARPEARRPAERPVMRPVTPTPRRPVAPPPKRREPPREPPINIGGRAHDGTAPDGGPGGPGGPAERGAAGAGRRLGSHGSRRPGPWHGHVHPHPV